MGLDQVGVWWRGGGEGGREGGGGVMVQQLMLLVGVIKSESWHHGITPV